MQDGAQARQVENEPIVMDDRLTDQRVAGDWVGCVAE